ncbi:MAG: PDZ domain-containing protein [Lawsonibacter sp.]|nr:PDZ domain-containing protein [Lawsonibacter sp.]
MKKLISRVLSLCLLLSCAVLPARALDLETAKSLLSLYYVDGVPQELLELDSLEEILARLNDPYTVYMDTSDYSSFMETVNGQVVVGIGVSIENAFYDGFRIMSILPGSPALEAGLQAGDRLVEVNGEPLTAAVDPRAVISGEAGTEVTVTVDREGERLERTMVRRAVNIPIVTFELRDGVAYINCLSFGESTAPTFQEAMTQLDEQTAVWLVDLRSNPGGTDRAAALSAGCFTGGGIMLYFQDGEKNLSYTALRPEYADLTDKPAILLLSPHSASGAELFAGAIRDYGAGIAVGQRTFGKGIAQLVFDTSNAEGFAEGEALKITAYRFYSPDGTTNHLVGILPSLVVSQENTEQAALLLRYGEPARAEDYLRLELASYVFYIDLAEAMSIEKRGAFTELLEALPPSAKLFQGTGESKWTEITPAQLARDRRLPLRPRTFQDVQASDFAREIQTLAAYQLLPGAGGSFRPKEALTREDFCVMAAGVLGLPEGDRGRFSDVDPSSSSAGPISAMAELGFLSGYQDGSFRPGRVMSCQELVTALSAIAAWTNLSGYDLSQTNLPAGQWLDYYEYAEWAQIPARNLDALGVLPEDLTPSAPAQRDLAAGLLCRLLENINLIWN